jgi:hypothetical protein
MSWQAGTAHEREALSECSLTDLSLTTTTISSTTRPPNASLGFAAQFVKRHSNPPNKTTITTLAIIVHELPSFAHNQHHNLSSFPQPQLNQFTFITSGMLPSLSLLTIPISYTSSPMSAHNPRSDTFNARVRGTSHIDFKTATTGVAAKAMRNEMSQLINTVVDPLTKKVLSLPLRRLPSIDMGIT